jgi:hypothetical protein
LTDNQIDSVVSPATVSLAATGLMMLPSFACIFLVSHAVKPPARFGGSHDWSCSPILVSGLPGVYIERMVFAPRGGPPFKPSADEVLEAELAAKLARERAPIHPPAAGARRLAWRAVVHTRDRENARTEWHLAACSSPASPLAHCPEGRRLLTSDGDPAGHCLVDAACGLCGAGV